MVRVASAPYLCPAGHARRGGRALSAGTIALDLRERTKRSVPVFALVCTLAACAAQQRPDGGKGMLPVGALAPDLAGHDQSDHEIHLFERRGKPSVVYFYPKDDTPGCTKEACAFRDTFEKFSARGITIFGVSRDSEASHVEFRKKYELPFPLVADESGAIQAAYGVPSRFGKAARVSFLIDGQGRVAKVWPDVDPALHADEVFAAADELQRIPTH
jgi:peroxiredoxin Q/BCP